MKHIIELDIQAQPDDQTCGPSCLYSLYRHFGDTELSLKQVIDQIEKLDHGGTLLEVLACHALRRGFGATIYSYHVQLLDPTWFAEDGGVHDADDVVARLKQQLQVKRGDSRFKLATKTLIDFLELGGDLRMEDLTPTLLSKYIAAGSPILTGLSSTYLYGQAREIGADARPDDVAGEPQGHFVMVVGYDPRQREVLIADPLDQNPPYHTSKYRVTVDRLVNAVMLGILTSDANLLVLHPKETPEKPVSRRRKPRPDPEA